MAALCFFCKNSLDASQICAAGKCGHVLHQSCWMKWLKGNPYCPECSQKTFENDIIRLYWKVNDPTSLLTPAENLKPPIAYQDRDHNECLAKLNFCDLSTDPESDSSTSSKPVLLLPVLSEVANEAVIENKEQDEHHSKEKGDDKVNSEESKSDEDDAEKESRGDEDDSEEWLEVLKLKLKLLEQKLVKLKMKSDNEKGNKSAVTRGEQMSELTQRFQDFLDQNL